MNLEQALEAIRQAIRSLNTTADMHDALKEAFEVVKAAALAKKV